MRRKQVNNNRNGKEAGGNRKNIPVQKEIRQIGAKAKNEKLRIKMILLLQTLNCERILDQNRKKYHGSTTVLFTEITLLLYLTTLSIDQIPKNKFLEKAEITVMMIYL